MKYMKKLTALLLAFILVLGLATTAMAAETYTLTLNGAQEGHTYTAYQIFTGDLSGSTLSNIVWGSGVTEAGQKALGDAAAKSEALESVADAEAFASEVAPYLGTAAGSVTIATGETSGEITGLEAGYYLVKTTAVTQENGVYTYYIMKVVKNTDATIKAGVPTLDKKITDDNNSIEDDIANDGKSDNVSVGSNVTYTLTGTIPAAASYYDYYYYIINDDLSEGLDFVASSVKVWIDADGDSIYDDGETVLAKGTGYYLYTGDDADGHTFQVALADAKALAGKTICVSYDATLNEKAKIGEILGNPNTADLDYSNNPNVEYDGTQDNDKPGKPASDKNVPLGDTPDSTVRTYTTGIKLIKVDENGNVLTGAEFTITGTNVKYVLVSSEEFKADENGTYYKLKNGTYTTEAPQTTDEYKEAEAGATAGYVKNEDGSYSEATQDDINAGKQLYILIEANADLYESTTQKYSKTVTYTVVGDDETETTVSAYVGADGVLYFNGLGEGTYTISETKTPVGYNTIKDFTVTIEWTAPADGSTDCDWTATSSLTGNKVLDVTSEGVFELTIENVSGSTLPETGGMGTTMFYLFGSIMVIAAVVLLVTKKRMRDAE